MQENEKINNEIFVDETGNPVETQYVDEFGNPIDPSLVDEFGNYVGNTETQYVDEFGNPIDSSLIDEFGNYISEPQNMAVDENALVESLNTVSGNLPTASAAAHQMDGKEMLEGMVTFDYNNVPITDIVNSIILDAINKGASDIHFDPFDDGIKIRIRVDGQLNDYSIVPLYVKRNMITRIKIISGMNITESRTPQDGAIRTELQNKTIDLRVSCLPTNMGEKIVIRIMDYSMSAAGIEALDFEEGNLEKVKRMLALPNGIILVTGATGAGKSTTVYSMLQRLNVEGTNLVTVEDPIEMNIGGINQVQAASEIGLTFASVLRSILRQDPDVIMIGEIRDDETARIAVRASITGHLVLSTIHTNNSLNTIERLTDMSVERYLLGSSLSGIISQKLSRRLCEKCKKLRPTTDYEKEIFKKVLNQDIKEIYEPIGCPECSRGYRGRIAIHEVLLLNQTIKDAITKGAPKDVLRKLVYSENGTKTMLQDGLQKVLEGKTSFEEILKLIDLEDDLGSGTQLGLSSQIEEANMNNAIPTQATTAPAQVTGPININITPELLKSLQIPLVMNNENTQESSLPVIKEAEEIKEEPIVEQKAKKNRKKKKKTSSNPPAPVITEEESAKINTPYENNSFDAVFGDYDEEKELKEIDTVLQDINNMKQEINKHEQEINVTKKFDKQLVKNIIEKIKEESSNRQTSINVQNEENSSPQYDKDLVKKIVEDLNRGQQQLNKEISTDDNSIDQLVETIKAFED